MKGLVLMLLMMTCLLVLPVGASYACGSKHKISKTEIKHTGNKKVYCNASDHPKSGSKKKMCGHSCDGSGCSCAHGSSVFALKTLPALLIQKTVFILSQANSWFFKESSPKPVYLSLWMPPNISC
jgi:hypothetical protein